MSESTGNSKHDKFLGKYRKQSARAMWHDYDGRLYFVTICTKERVHYFGEISENEMHLTEVGQYVVEQIRNVQVHYNYAKIPLWVVMPNHLHAIVIIDGDNIPYKRRVVKTLDGSMVESRRATTLQQRGIANMQGWLSVVVGGIKSAVTKFANERGIPFVWQTRFHDHIVRDICEMNQIADYIENNVQKWEMDKFYV